MRILKIESLPPVSKQIWIDRDEIMLHSCFQLLKDFVEKEKFEKTLEYKHHKPFIDEVRTLYKWWKKRSKKTFTNDILEMKNDDEMLIRLMKIRTQLWT